MNKVLTICIVAALTLVVGSVASANLVTLAESPPNLALVTHGMHTDANGWVDLMANGIAMQLGLNVVDDVAKWTEDDDSLVHKTTGTWEVATYDWRKGAKKLWPPTAARNARSLGRDHLGPKLASQGYDSLHLIAHSAGCWLIDAIADLLGPSSDIDIHITFLDAYVPTPTDDFKPEFLGDSATWAEQYVSKETFPEDLPHTDFDLPNCFNIEVTSIAPTHSGPWEWYLDTVFDPEASGAYGWGFAKTREHSGTHPSFEDYSPGTVNPIPEPATVLLLGLGGLALLRKRRAKS